MNLTPVPVQSSLLASVSYESDQSILVLEFHANPARYRYFDVPPDIHRTLLAADSKGSCFNRCIRNRFRYERIEPAR
jgi:hypothetical protein